MCQTTKEQRAKRRAFAKVMNQADAALWETRRDPEAHAKVEAALEIILAAFSEHPTMCQTEKEERAKLIAALEVIAHFGTPLGETRRDSIVVALELIDQVATGLGEARRDPEAFGKAYAAAKLKPAPLIPYDEAEAHWQASQKASLDAWKKEQAAENTRGPKIRMWIRRSFTDDETCIPCRKGNGDAYYALEDIDWWPGNDCEGGPDCRCELIAIYADEGKLISYGPDDDWVYMPEIECLASRKFGEAWSRQKSEAISLYRETRRKYLEAWSCERKKDIPQAVSLYRETVQIHKSIGEMYSVGVDWAHMDYVLDRLTLVLAENGRPDEALAEMVAYRALGREAQPASTTWKAIVKREARLRKRLAHQKAGPGARRKASDKKHAGGAP